MSAKYSIQLIDGALNYYLGVNSVIEHPQIPGYYNIGNNIMKTQYHCYNQIPTNLGVLRPLFTWEMSNEQYHESSNIQSSSAGVIRQADSKVQDVCSNILNNFMGTLSALTTFGSPDIIITNGKDQVSESQMITNYGLDYYKNNNVDSFVPKTFLVGNGTYNQDMTGSSSFHSGGQSGNGFIKDTIQGYTTDTFIKRVGNIQDLDFDGNYIKFGVFGTSMVPHVTIGNPPSKLSAETTTNVTYDAVVYSKTKTKIMAYMANESDMFGYMHILEYTGDNSTITGLSNYVTGSESAVNGKEKCLILLDNLENPALGTDYKLVATIVPTEYTLPKNTYSDGQIVRYFRSQQTRDGNWTDANTIKTKLSPYNPVWKDGEYIDFENRSQFDYGNSVVKAFPVLMGYNDGDTKPSVIYQPSNFRNFKTNDFSINGENEGFTNRWYGKPKFSPFKPITETNTAGNTEIITTLSNKYPGLVNASSNYETDILNKVSVDVYTGGEADPDNNYAYLDLDYSWLKNTKCKMTGKLGCFLGNSFNLTNIESNNVIQINPLSGNYLSTLVLPSSDGRYTANTGGVFSLPTGTEPITDLYTSIALVNGIWTPSSNCHMCAYNDRNNLYYTSKAYYPNAPIDGLKVRAKNLIDIVNSDIYSSSNPNGMVDRVLYVKMILANITGGPSSANLRIFKNGKEYDISGNGNNLQFSHDENDMPVDPQPGKPENPDQLPTTDNGLVYLKS